VPLALRATNACRAYKAATMRPATETTATATAATWLQLQQVTATLASLKLLFVWPACISLLSSALFPFSIQCCFHVVATGKYVSTTRMFLGQPTILMSF